VNQPVAASPPRGDGTPSNRVRHLIQTLLSFGIGTARAETTQCRKVVTKKSDRPLLSVGWRAAFAVLIS
jgi:hypothetical protein